MSESWIENAPNMQLANLLDQIGIGTVRTKQIQRAFATTPSRSSKISL